MVNLDAMRARWETAAKARLSKAAAHAANAIKETISVPAPRTRVKTARGNYYRAKTWATQGAPPRKLSGRLRASIAWRLEWQTLSAVVGSNVRYAGVWNDQSLHPYVGPTLARERAALDAYLRGDI